MILFAVSTLSYTDTRTIGWPFLMTIPAVSAASAVANDRFVCLSTWSKNRPTSGRLLCESTSCTVSGAGSSASRSLITRVAIRCLFLLKNDSLGTVRYWNIAGVCLGPIEHLAPSRSACIRCSPRTTSMFSSELPGRGLHSPRPVSPSRPDVVIPQCKTRGTRRGGLVVGAL